jgi:hypothetical protein
LRVIEYDLRPYFGKKKTSALIASGDWHIGNSAFHEDCLDSMLKRAKSRPWIGLADFIEGIMPDDPRFAITQHESTFMQELQYAGEKISKAADTCIGLLSGNHENKASRKVGDVIEGICNVVDIQCGAKVKNLSNTCFVVFICPDGQFTAFFSHGGSTTNARAGEPERKVTNKRIWLRNYLADFHADLKGIGHGHRRIITPPVMEHRLTIEQMRVKRKPVPTRAGWNFMSPCMFTTYDQDCPIGNYAEEKLYPSTALGWIEVVIARDGTIPSIQHRGDKGQIVYEAEPTVVD